MSGAASGLSQAARQSLSGAPARVQAEEPLPVIVTNFPHFPVSQRGTSRARPAGATLHSASAAGRPNMPELMPVAVPQQPLPEPVGRIAMPPVPDMARTSALLAGIFEGAPSLFSETSPLSPLPDARIVRELAAQASPVPAMPSRGIAEGQDGIDVHLNQKFEFAGMQGGVDEVRRRLVSAGPEFVSLVRRDLSDIVAQDRRVAHAQ